MNTFQFIRSLTVLANLRVTVTFSQYAIIFFNFKLSLHLRVIKYIPYLNTYNITYILNYNQNNIILVNPSKIIWLCTSQSWV